MCAASRSQQRRTTCQVVGTFSAVMQEAAAATPSAPVFSARLLVAMRGATAAGTPNFNTCTECLANMYVTSA